MISLPKHRLSKATNLLRRHRVKCRGTSMVELSVYMIAAAILGSAGIYVGYQQIQNARGNACTQYLQQINTECDVVAANQGVTDASQLSSILTTTTLAPYLNGATIGTTMACPSGGTYALPTTFVAGTYTPSNPTCSIATTLESVFKGTMMHSITPVP